MTTELDNTRHVLRHVVTDGQPPNGTAPSDCGPFAETVELIYAAYDKGGTPAVRRVWASVVRANPKLGDLISEDKPEPAQPAQSSGWGAILPFRNFDLPEFPLDVLPPWLRDYCQAVTNTMQTPPDLAGMLALSVVSTACARRVMVKAWDGWVEPVNVYTVTSLPPGSRKSPVFRAMMGPINMFERKLLEKSGDEITRAETEREILKSKLEEAKRKASKMQGSEYSLKMAWSEVDGIAGEVKDKPWLFTKDGQLVARSGNLTMRKVIFPETASVFSKCGQPEHTSSGRSADGNGDMPAWCTKAVGTAAGYLRDGPLYFVDKNNRPYVLAHFPSHQVYNVHDRPLDANVVREIAPLFADTNRFPIAEISRGSEALATEVNRIRRTRR